jgi:ABC-2 type transport system ATP-binding protein
VPMVRTERLTKRYPRVAALVDCSLEVERGEVFGLLGPNGAGKTTLIRLLLGYLRPTSGTATIDDLDCAERSVDVRMRVSYLPGEARLFRQMRGYELLEFFARVRPRGDAARSRAYAARLDLDLTRPVAAMSTGMRQKLALAAALAADTALVILDEPTANLDPTVRLEVGQLVREARAAGRTVMFSSHVLSEVEDVCDRVVILRGGQLVHVQEMSALKRRHRIRAVLDGPIPAAPPALGAELTVERLGERDVVIETPGDLSPLLGWLATLPLRDVSIEPAGLRSVYERFHGSSQSKERA